MNSTVNVGRASAQASSSLLPASWRVELPEFEGPLDLLLHLVRINEIEITDIPVALICDQFHAYLDLMDELDLDIAADYIYEAALLIQLKARVLLPQPEPAPGEEPEDPRRELIERLLEYQRLKEAAQTLAEVDSLRHGLWTRGRTETVAASDEEEFDLGDLSLFDLLQVLRGVLKRYDEEHPSPLVYSGETFSVRGQIERLLSRFEGGRSLDLKDDLFALSSRAEAIACFLAVLEMARLNLVRLHPSDAGSVFLFRTTRALDPVLLEDLTG
ncbi:MAG: segregation/condensation protein A [Acidobacteria bacterium]|nr:segregation/condensation protein A [Acidobacteriota bacterium]